MNTSKKFIFSILAGGLLVLPACTEQESPQGAENGAGAISFNVTVPAGSRSDATTTATIKDFTVYAFTEGSVLIDGAKVTRTGGSWTYSPAAYWPVNPVNFYAYSPDIITGVNITGEGGGNIPGYINDGQTDLLYSVLKGATNQAAPVQLNFRHALSKVSVMMSSSNTRIRVDVSYISVKNLYISGSFNFPDASTLASAPQNSGSWTELKQKSELMTFAVIGTEDAVSLTPQPTDYSLNNLDCSYVIPQPLTEVELSEQGYAGTYIEVDCEIYDSATGAKLWPNSNTPQYMLVPHTEAGRIVYPATSDNVKAYKPGHEYIYNISINNPTVLDKIEFDVTVDDYNINEM